MSEWISTIERLPEEETLVRIKLTNGKIRLAKITRNEYNEMVWLTMDWEEALVRDFTKEKGKEAQMLTEPDLPPPTHWMEIEK